MCIFITRRTAVVEFFCRIFILQTFCRLIYGKSVSSVNDLRTATRCIITAADFLSSNALSVSWNTSLSVDDATRCQLRLVDVNHRNSTLSSCSGRVVLERVLPATHTQYTLWSNATKPGVIYKLCMRKNVNTASSTVSDHDTSTSAAAVRSNVTVIDDDADREWSAVTLFVELRQPPVIVDNCSVRMRGVSAIVNSGEFIYVPGSSVSLSCDISGSPNTSWCWYKDAEKAKQSDCTVQEGGVTVTFYVDRATADDAGDYVLRGCNRHGQVRSSTFSLKMAELQSVIQSPHRSVVHAGDSVQLRCRRGTSVPAPVILWYHTSSKTGRRRARVRPSERVAVGVDGSLIFLSLASSDSGNYTCEAVNEKLNVGETGSLHEVLVTAPDYNVRRTRPEIVSSYTLPKTVWGLVGDTVKLQCLFSGRPTPKRTWSRSGRLLSTTENRDSRYRWSVGSHTLRIAGLTLDDAGRYQCNASNSEGYRIYSVNLRVYSKPQWTDRPRSVNATVGQTVSFSCRAFSNPPPNLRWFINNNDVTDSPSTAAVGSRESRLIVSSDGLTIRNVTMNDTASIQCYASNDHGYVLSSVYLNVYAKTVITKFPSDALVGSGRRTTTLRCLAVTDQLTSLRIQWIADNNASDNCASWRTVDERQQQVLVELDQSHTCCAVTCSASNGLTKDSSSARVCWANGTRTIFTGYRHGGADGASTLWPLVVGLLVVVVVAVVGFAVVCRSRGTRRSHAFLRQCSQTSHTTLCTQLSITGNSAVVHGGTLRSIRRTALTADALSDSTNCLVCESGWCSMPVLRTLNGELRSAVAELLIPRERLLLGEAIGKGQFGRVLYAELESARGSFRQHVAVKTMKFKPDETDMVELFLREAVIMKDFEHINVLRIVGVSFETDGSPMVILPYMANADLRQYILNPSHDVTILELLKMGLQVARGMQYLSNLRFIHRDLAARNCMVDERGTVKVADFGLSRELLLRDYYRSDGSGMTPVPVRWLAPESLEASVFTTMSDVWSFGVLLWELMTRGAVPYSDVENWQIPNYVQAGNRLMQPAYCPDVVFSIMCLCWHDEPSVRPTFDELVASIDNVISKARRGSRTDDSRLYLNIARSSTSVAEPPAHSESGAPVPPGDMALPDAQVDDDGVVEDEVRYT